MLGNVESVYGTPEMNITLYVSYIETKIKNKYSFVCIQHLIKHLKY